MKLMNLIGATALFGLVSMPVLADTPATAGNMPMKPGQMMQGQAGQMPMKPGQMKGGMMHGGGMGMMMNPEMMKQRQEMMQKHMATMEQHMANIERLLGELVALQKQK